MRACQESRSSFSIRGFISVLCLEFGLSELRLVTAGERHRLFAFLEPLVRDTFLLPSDVHKPTVEHQAPCYLLLHLNRKDTDAEGHGRGKGNLTEVG